MLRQMLAVLFVLILPACSGLGQGQPFGGAGAQGAPDVVSPRELIVLEAAPGGRTVAAAQALGYGFVKMDQLPALDDVLITLRIPAGRDIPQAIDEIEAAVPGVTAGAHHLYRLQAEPAAGPSYANALMGWPARGCRAVRGIGMIDAGLPARDVRLRDGSVVQNSFVGSAEPAGDHGALMASLLVGPGRVTGTTLFSAVAVDPARRGGDTAGVVAILQAVDWLAGRGVDVVNISLAGPRNKLLNRGLGRAAADGMLMVAAVGNVGPDAPPQYPAAFPFVIAVTAVDEAQTVYRKAVRGDHIDLAAPGVDIVINTADGLRVLSGTSAAAPFVTGAIAADRRFARSSVATVRRGLWRGARDLGRAGRDTIYGAGLVGTPAGC